MEFQIIPVPKPRMTTADRWQKRPAVVRYFEFKDKLVQLATQQFFNLPNEFKVTFIMPMAKSWSNKQRTKMEGQPHQQRPDWDNLAKALCDALKDEDMMIYHVEVLKVWGIEGKIIIEEI